jgi:pimeloyl-ACP methyl ester carboxylesterase
VGPAASSAIARRNWPTSGHPLYDYDTLADDLAAVIQQTEAQDAVSVGFSMGGGEVARYMSRHDGQSVSKAALISSVLTGTNGMGVGHQLRPLAPSSAIPS